MSGFRTRVHVKYWKSMPKFARLNLRIVRWHRPPIVGMYGLYRPMIIDATQAAEVWLHENLA